MGFAKNPADALVLFFGCLTTQSESICATGVTNYGALKVVSVTNYGALEGSPIMELFRGLWEMMMEVEVDD